MISPFSNKQLRSIHDPTTGGYWFSVVDLCAILTDSDHKTARNYWKRLKYKLENNQVVTVGNHLKLKSPNGKYYFTEVVDLKTLVRLIQTCPSPKANPYRLWLADILFDGISITEVEKELAKLGEASATEVVEKYMGKEPYARLTVHKENLLQ